MGAVAAGHESGRTLIEVGFDPGKGDSGSIFAGGSPDPAPVTNSACFSTITMTQASWLHALYQYDSTSASMKVVPAAAQASFGWSGENFKDMGKWFQALMADTFS